MKMRTIAMAGLGWLWETSKVLSVLAVVALMVHAQTFTSPANPIIRFWEGRPTPGVNVCGGVDCYLQHYDVAAHGTAGSWSISHGGTNCGGSACMIDDTVPLAANTSYHWNAGGMYCQGGCVFTTTGTVDVSVRWSLLP